VIAIIAILAAILFPVFAQAREKSRQAMCMSHLRQVGLAMSMYVQANQGLWPEPDDLGVLEPGEDGSDRIPTSKLIPQGFAKNPKIFWCTAEPKQEKGTPEQQLAHYGQTSYRYFIFDDTAGYAGPTKPKIPGTSGPKKPSEQWLAREQGWNVSHLVDKWYPNDKGVLVRAKTKNILFYDGHVKAERIINKW